MGPPTRPHASISFHLGSPLFFSLSSPLRAAVAALALGYAAVLVASATLTIPLLFLAGFLFAVTVEVLRWRGVPDAVAIVLFWAPLHLLIMATGSLASPALPLAAAWVVATGVVRRAWAPWAALAGTALLLLGAFTAPQLVHVPDVLRLLLLVALAAVVPRFFGLSAGPGGHGDAARRPREVRAGTRFTPASSASGRRGGRSLPPAPHLVHLVRRATVAAEAIVWERQRENGALRPVARSGSADAVEPAAIADLTGHPYSWAMQEGKPVRLQRGRKPLPRASATEMLLLPFDHGRRLLTLSYTGAAPPASEAAAVSSVNALEELGALMESHTGPDTVDEAPADAGAGGSEGTPSALHLEPFAALLVRATADLAHAEGAALVLWSSDADRGWLVAWAGVGPAVDLPSPVRGSDSQAATACTTGRALRLDDRNREAPNQPLLVPAECWDEQPKSAMIRPVRAEGQVIGVLVAWDSAPNHFHLRDEEAADLLAAVAAPVLQHAAREVQLFHGAVPGLAERAVFESRLAGLCGRFHRYSRPFAVMALEVDHLDRIIEAWGPEVGGMVLQHVAAMVRSALREVDLIARPDGAEFAMLLPETTLDAALAAAERIRHALQTTNFAADGRRLALTASFGVAACPDSCAVATDTLGEARAALQRSKLNGTNRVSAAAPRR